MTTITTELAQELRERYTSKPAPKCHICGSEMSMQRAGGGSLTYGCFGRIDTGDEGYIFAAGRDFGDNHYAESRVTIAARGDDDVIAVLDALAAKDTQIANRDEQIAELVEDRISLTGALHSAEPRIAAAEKRLAELEATLECEREKSRRLMSRIVELEARPEQQPVVLHRESREFIVEAIKDATSHGEVDEIDHQLAADLEKLLQPIYTSAPSAPTVVISETNDQIAAVMMQHGTPEQQSQALVYANGLLPAPAAQPVTVKLPDPDDDQFWMEGSTDFIPEKYRKALTAALTAAGITIAEGE